MDVNEEPKTLESSVDVQKMIRRFQSLGNPEKASQIKTQVEQYQKKHEVEL